MKLMPVVEGVRQHLTLTAVTATQIVQVREAGLPAPQMLMQKPNATQMQLVGAFSSTPLGVVATPRNFSERIRREAIAVQILVGLCM
jgi:hypothetical protein